jgi:hypothetical protein
MRRPLLIPLLALALALVCAAGCSGGDEDDGSGAATEGSGTGTTAATGDFGQEDPRFGQLLIQFTKEAEAGDALGMWNLLSSATQASIGPTLTEFRNGAAREFEEGVGSLAPGAEVILSRLMGDFGVGAIASEREAEGEGEQEYFAYAVAFLEEEGEWKIELGGIVITGLAPEPLATTGPRPQLAANVGAGANLGNVVMFLDSEPFPAEREGDSPFAAKLRGQPAEDLAAGHHTVVVFADSGLTASAIAWTFDVREGGS